MQRIVHVRGGLVAAMLMALTFADADAEPYLAVETGLKCVNCHVNPSGGGKRNEFGVAYARAQLAERVILSDDDSNPWDGTINRWLGVGGDYRGGYRSIDVPGAPSNSDWMTSRATVYLNARALDGLVSVYVDEQLSPGSRLNREAYVMVSPENGRYRFKAGQFFLPFGLRLQDDATFVRQRSGINFDTPDEGFEFGIELPRWSVQAARSDGTAGAGSQSGKRQNSLSAVYVRNLWRVGMSVNDNQDPLGDRQMQALFAGFRTGLVSWLAEIDLIEDELPGGGDREIYASLIEGNWRLRKGHNLKVGYEFLDPSDLTGEDEQERYSVVWEYSPIQLLQVRAGVRIYNGIPELPTSNRDEFLLEFHAFF
jgi:hypothetical protein